MCVSVCLSVDLDEAVIEGERLHDGGVLSSPLPELILGQLAIRILDSTKRGEKRVCVCAYVCVHVCVRVCICVHMCVCV